MTRARLVPASPIGLTPLEVDVTVSLSDDESASLASHPVEEGLQLTDEINFSPRVLAVDLVFLDLAPSAAGVSGPGRAERLLAQLRAFYKAKARISLVQPDAPTIDDLVLARIGVRRDKATGRARPVSVMLQQIRIASLDIVEAVLDADVQALGGLNNVDLGLLP